MKLSIPQTCSQNWEKMQAQDTGRFCKHCQKNVYDFSNWDDQKIREFIEQKQGNVCGRFKSRQLNRPLNKLSPLESRSRNTLWPFLAVGLGISSPVLGQTLSADKISLAAESSKWAEAKSDSGPEKVEHKGKDSLRVLRGSIIDSEYQEALIGVNISLKGTSLGTVSDIHGSFELKIPLDSQKQSFSLVFSSVGYQSEEREFISGEPELDSLSIVMQESEVKTGEIIVVGNIRRAGFFRRLWWKFKRLFRRRR